LTPTSKCRFSPRVATFDALWIALAPFTALALRDESLLRFDLASPGAREACQYALITIVCALPAAAAFHLRDGLSRDFAFVDVWAILGVAGVASSASTAVIFSLNRLDYIPRSTPLIYAMVLVAGLAGGRAIARAHGSRRMAEAREAGARPRRQARRVIIIGIDGFSTLAIKLAQRQAPCAVEIVAALDPRERLSDRTVSGVRIVGAPADLVPIIREYAEHGICVDEVWFSDPLIAESPEAHRALSDACRVAGLKSSSISGALNLTATGPEYAHNEAAPTAAVAPAPGYFRLRRPLEAAAAAALLAGLTPAAAIVGAIIAIDLGAPVIFWQERIGRNGRKFLLYKFRTLHAPFARDGAAVSRDRRTSTIGGIVRKSRLDEIPQLWNVIRGEMALIGPRPLLPVDQPADSRTRLLVRPGITGWAQVNGGTALTAEEKDALDSWYIRHASPELDLQVMWRTVCRFGRGERRDASAIEQAMKWRREAKRPDDRPFPERGDESEPNVAWRSPIKRLDEVGDLP
jgi:lipopolysaccharide/colanic/teichoic acid biosynthesis glycosyltransferase